MLFPNYNGIFEFCCLYIFWRFSVPLLSILWLGYSSLTPSLESTLYQHQLSEFNLSSQSNTLLPASCFSDQSHTLLPTFKLCCFCSSRIFHLQGTDLICQSVLQFWVNCSVHSLSSGFRVSIGRERNNNAVQFHENSHPLTLGSQSIWRPFYSHLFIHMLPIQLPTLNTISTSYLQWKFPPIISLWESKLLHKSRQLLFFHFKMPALFQQRGGGLVFLRVTLPHWALTCLPVFPRTNLSSFPGHMYFLAFLICLILQAQSIDIYIYIFIPTLPQLPSDYLPFTATCANDLFLFTHFLFTVYSLFIYISPSGAVVPFPLRSLDLLTLFLKHMVLLPKRFYLETPLASAALLFPGCLFLLP